MKKLLLDLDGIDEHRVDTLCQLHDIKREELTLHADAGDDAYGAWAVIKEHDEIYVDSALIYKAWGLCAGDMFNLVMHKAAEEDVRGKKVYFFRCYKDIHWGNIKARLVEKAFEHNELYCYTNNEDAMEFMKVDIASLLNECE